MVRLRSEQLWGGKEGRSRWALPSLCEPPVPMPTLGLGGAQESPHSTLQQSLALDNSNALESGISVLRAVCIVPSPRRLSNHEGRHSDQISS